jgi:hypothetical protein
MRRTITVSHWIASLPAAYGQDGDSPDARKSASLPATARRVLKHYMLTVVEAKRDYETNVVKAADTTRKELVKIHEQETMAGRGARTPQL